MSEELVSFNRVRDLLIPLREQNVLLDFTVAKLYGVATKRINEAVKNNPEKFPDGYIFEVTSEEVNKFAVEIFDRKLKPENWPSSWGQIVPRYK